MTRFLCFAILCISLSSQAGIRAGYSQEKLTPTIQEAQLSCLGGYGGPGSRCGVTKIYDDISIRVLAISEKNKYFYFRPRPHREALVLLAVIDTVGVGDSIIRDIRNSVFEKSNGRITKESIYITATHTHSGPDLQGLWGGISEEYRERIVSTSTRAILSAYTNQTPVTISVWQADASVENRRGWDEVDSTINVMEFRSKRFDYSIATLINMSGHPAILDAAALGYSADYVHQLRETFEHDANTNVVFINGILGDAQPIVDGPRTPETAYSFGESMAMQALAQQNTAEAVYGHLTIEQIPFTHPVENPLILGAVQVGLLDLDIDEDQNVNTQIGIMSIGNKVSAIMFPGESLTRVGLPIKSKMDSNYDFFFGLSGDSLGYFIPSDEFLQIPGRTTEETASLSPGIGDMIGKVIGEYLEQERPHH